MITIKALLLDEVGWGCAVQGRTRWPGRKPVEKMWG